MAAESPPVAITMGSMVTFDPVAFAGTVREALKLAGLRGVLIGGWSEEASEESCDEHCFRAANIPYEWLFPRSSLVVHHGGAGTVAATLRAGRPSILLPQIPSQGYFAQLLARAGVLAEELDVQNWTSAALAIAMRRATEEISLHEAAVRWQKAVIAEHGLTRAVELIEAHSIAT
jgi:sterol 3beta-glucosyltransferase